MVAIEMGMVNPNRRLSTAALTKIVKIATPLKESLERSRIHEALVAFYGDSSEFVWHSLDQAEKENGKLSSSDAVLRYLIDELLELSGNCAANKDRATIRSEDVDEAIDLDEELAKLKKYG